MVDIFQRMLKARESILFTIVLDYNFLIKTYGWVQTFFHNSFGYVQLGEFTTRTGSTQVTTGHPRLLVLHSQLSPGHPSTNSTFTIIPRLSPWPPENA